MGFKQYVYAQADSEWYDTFLSRCEKTALGMNAISLTNWTTSTACAIAEGSVGEVGGAVFICTAETAITGSIASGLNYIFLSVTDTTLSPYWTTAIGAWSESKQGFYTNNDRMIGGCDSAAGSTYDNKFLMQNRSSIKSGMGDTAASLPGGRAADLNSNSHPEKLDNSVQYEDVQTVICPIGSPIGQSSAVFWVGHYVGIIGSHLAWCDVFLPDGSVITGFTGYTSASGLEADLCRRVHNAATNDHDVLAEGGGDFDDTSISNPTVDNSIYNYFVILAETAGTNRGWYGGHVSCTVTGPRGGG